MNELIKTIPYTDGSVVVSGRDLHSFLGVETRFNDWFQRMSEYGFTEGHDFYSFLSKTPNGCRPRTDYVMSLDMAKEVAMLQRTEKGKQARQYFILIEKQYRQQQSPYRVPTTFVEAMQLATKEAEQIAKMQPKVDYFDTQMHNPGLMTTTVIAKSFGKSATWLNRWLETRGLIYRQGKSWVVRQKFAAEGYADYENWSDGDNSHVHALLKWTQKGQKFIYDCLAKEGIYPIAVTMRIPSKEVIK